jgi:hypothetical protein
MGDDPVGDALHDMVRGETVNGRSLAVKKIRRAPARAACQVVFIPKSEKDAPAVIAVLGAGVLTVGEENSFLHEGGTLAFVIENRRVRFDVNINAATNAMLTISSRLLSVARTVER